METNKAGRKLVLWAVLGCVLIGTYFLVVRMAAQRTSASAVIRGTIRSTNTIPLHGILVKARRDGDKHTTSVFTDLSGNYDFPQLPLGNYKLTVGTQWEQTVQLSTSGARQDFSVELGPGFINQTTGATWLQLVPGRTVEEKIPSGCGGGGCHTAWRLFRDPPRSAEAWAAIVRRMATQDLAGRPAASGGSYSGEDISKTEEIARLLSNNITPELMQRSMREAIVRPTGESARAVFTEWDLPSQNKYGVDYVTGATVDSNGIIWYVGSVSNVVGRLDPHTGAVQEWTYTGFPASKDQLHEVENAHLHDTLIDKDGNLWVTSGPAERAIKFDTKTYKFTDWVLPGRAHTGDVDPDGNYWVTINAIGGPGFAGVAKVDPRTGRVTEYPSPTNGRPAPYGLSIDQQGTVWYTEIQANNIGKIDRATGKITIYPVPTPNAGPRRIVPDSKGKMWFTESSANKLGVLDPVTAKITEYDIGIPGFPYGIRIDRLDKVWISMANGNTLGKFDPQTRQFVFYLLPTPESFGRDIWFDYTTNPFAAVYGVAQKAMLGRMYVR